MMSTSLDTLTPGTRWRAEALMRQALELGIETKVASTRRTCAQQNDLWAQGITPAKGCRSWHTWGRAVDLFVVDDGKLVSNGSDPRYRKLGEIARTLGMKWGGDFNDPIHFEYHPGLSQKNVCPDPDLCEETVATTFLPEDTEPGPLQPASVMQRPAGGMSTLAVLGFVGATVGAVLWIGGKRWRL